MVVCTFFSSRDECHRTWSANRVVKTNLIFLVVDGVCADCEIQKITLTPEEVQDILSRIVHHSKWHRGPAVCLGDGQTEAEEYCRKVDAATRCSGICPHT